MASRSIAGSLTLLTLSLLSSTSSAQMQPLEEGVAVGEWTFYPSLEARVRGEYFHDLPTASGPQYAKRAVQSDGFQSPLPEVLSTTAHVDHVLLMSERARLGMEVRYDVITGKLVLQDARMLGSSGGYGRFEPNEAYVDVRTSTDDPWLWVRAGRQRVTWGDGRLVGDSEWSPRGRSLDALRMHFAKGDFNVEAMGAILFQSFPAPAPYPQSPGIFARSADDGGSAISGAQLVGLDATWRIFPLLGIELTGLARFARDPLDAELTRGDTYTIDLRAFGELRGFEYAIEGAYQLGRVASFGVNRDINAFAVAGRVAWQTALPLNFRFGARGAYASGDDSNGSGEKLERFDPILPTQHEHHGMMDMYAWSNVIEAGGDVSIRPHDMLTIGSGYTFVGLAQPTDRWSTGYLLPIGANENSEGRVLGHEIDMWLTVAPWDFLAFSGGYGAFILGSAGKAIMSGANHGDTALLHYGMLQTELRVP
jgi:hypothetical protein